MFDAVAVADEGGEAVEFVDSFVEFLMSLAQLVRHDVDIVEVGESGVWKLGTRVDN